jgi:hypothetical protein
MRGSSNAASDGARDAWSSPRTGSITLRRCALREARPRIAERGRGEPVLRTAGETVRNRQGDRMASGKRDTRRKPIPGQKPSGEADPRQQPQPGERAPADKPGKASAR